MVRRPRSTEKSPLPLVARERELGLLEAMLERAADGHGGTALVSGEAGIGKTALVNALTRRAESREALVLTGACYDRTATPPYGPWRELADQFQRHDAGDTVSPSVQGFLVDGQPAGRD